MASSFPLWGLEEINYPSLLHMEDSFVPENCQETNLIFSDFHHLHPQNDARIELPSFQDCYNVDYFLGGGFDGFVGYQQMSVANVHGYPTTLNCSPSAYHVTTNLGTWDGVQSGQKMSSTHAEEPTTKVRRYSAEERRDRILRYLKKRNQRNFNKTIKYECRKTLADRRARVRGRFAKNNEDDDKFNANRSSLLNHEVMNISPCSYYGYASHNHQKKEEGEEWLEEAIANMIMYHSISIT